MPKSRKKLSIAESIDALTKSTKPTSFDPEDVDFDGTSAYHHNVYSDNTDDEDIEMPADGHLRLRADIDDSSEDETYLGKAVTRSDLYNKSEESGSETNDEVEDSEDEYSSVMESMLSSANISDMHEPDDDNASTNSSNSVESDDEDEEEVIDNELKLIANQATSYDETLMITEQEELKSLHAQRQQQLWSDVLETRILMQSTVVSSNTLPASNIYDEILDSNDDIKSSVNKTIDSFLPILDDLIEIRDTAIKSNPMLLKATLAAVESGVAPAPIFSSSQRKRPRSNSLTDYWNEIDGGTQRMEPYVTVALDRWNDKVQLSSGRSGQTKKFKSLNQNIVEQVDLIMGDVSRVHRKAHTIRSDYNIIGSESSSNNKEDGSSSNIGGSFGMNFENYDDSDFYHQLLKQLLQSGDSSSKVLNSSETPAAIQYRYPRVKKRGHSKASKGRKLKFTVHPKLVNFMAPEPAFNAGVTASISGESLLNSLFGKVPVNSH